MNTKHAPVFFLFFVILLLPHVAVAQKADVALSFGASSVSDTHLNFDCPLGVLCINIPPESVKTGHALFWEGTFNSRMIDAKLASIHLEIPIAGTAHQQATFTQSPNAFIAHFSSLYITPSIKTKFFPAAPISPWISLGGGLAHFSFPDDRSNKFALQFGTGADIKTPLPHLGFRVELRDFLSGQPSFATPGIGLAGSPESGLSRHNVFAGGGVVFHF
ncbi:MAG TPA: hypothetical protein VKH81_10890 [Candidatus Angelobacter sp.]|nr:hypothetical protein [Candidatus Angelobacter sp.]